MSDTKMMQAILDKVNSFDERFDSLDKKIDAVNVNLSARIDKLVLQLARLEDDAPTIEEFEKLTRRVTKLENRVFES